MKNLRIAQQLGLAFGAMVLLVLASGAMLWVETRQSEERVAVARRATTGAVALSEAQSALWRLRDGFPQFVVGDEALRKKIVDDEPTYYAIIDKSLQTYAAAGLGKEERNSLKALRDIYAKYIEARPKWLELDTEEKLAEAKLWRATTATTYGPGTVKAFSDLIEVQQKASQASHTAALEELKTLQFVMLGLALVAITAGIALSTAIIRGLQAKLGGEPAYAKLVASHIADGDLGSDVEVRPGDTGSMLWAMKKMRDNLRAVVGDVSAGARSVADTSAQIAQGNLDLSQRTEEQATTLEETASSMEQLTSTVAHNADNARQASQLAVGASEVARKGGQVVGQVVSTMTEISTSSRRIGDIIGVIDGIAFQTNILALNAAVEAARAGEQGRGFAVVAAEVRNLAQRSAAAAREIKGLIADSVGKVDAGTRLVDEAGATMQEIVTSVKKVSDLIAEIAAASQEQSAGIGQVNTAVAQMEQVVQQNASLVEEASAATEAMKEQAASLLEGVSRFQLGGQHEHATPSARPANAWRVPPAPIGRARPATALPPAYAAIEGSARPQARNGEWEEF